MIRFEAALKTAVIAVLMIALTPLIHSALGLLVSQEASITGEPTIPILLPFVCVQAVLMVVVFGQVKDHLPVAAGWSKGLLFGSFFLLAVQVPSVFGVIAFEPGRDWEWFTPAKVANYSTLLGDTLVFLAVGTALGLLFPSRREAPPGLSRGLVSAMITGAVAFPLGLFGIVHLAFLALPLDDPNAPVGRSLWFDLIFYGAFFMTGLCFPWLHGVLRRIDGAAPLRRVLRSTALFGLLWLPVQNFMVVFGWEVGGALVFSTLSMAPVFLVFALSERLARE